MPDASAPHASSTAATNGDAPLSPQRVVEEFLAALERLDLDAAMALVTDDLVYQNVPLPPTRSREGARRLLATFIRPGAGFEAKIRNIAANGDIVLTERTDKLAYRGFWADFWVCGTFELRDGKIAVWRDYFDFADLTVNLFKGLGRAVGSLARA